MHSLEYLHKVITQSELIGELSWVVKAFALPINVTTDESWKANYTRYDLVYTPSGYSFIDVVNDTPTLVKLDDYKPNTPLYTFQDSITIDKTWGINIPNKVTSKIGNVIINTLCVIPAFGDKIDFISEPVTIHLLEATIVKELNNKVTVDEMVNFIDRLFYITNFSMFTNIGATARNITSPPNFKQQKQEILAKYEGQLKDPIKLVEFEKELIKIDDEYLKGDPTVGKTLVGKAKNISRKKMLLTFGYERGFSDTTEITPIINSLEEGWDTSDEAFSSYMNSLRSGSYARGKETELGGVLYKKLQRALSGLVVADEDCGTTTGLTIHITKDNYNILLHREVKVGTKWVLISNVDEATTYIDKVIVLRSAMYCEYKGDGYCYHCLSSTLKNNPTSISMMVSEVSSICLNMFMGLMHGVQLSTVDIEKKDLVC